MGQRTDLTIQFVHYTIALQILNSVEDNDQKLELFIRLGDLYREQAVHHPEKALQNLQDALRVSKKRGYTLRTVKILYKLARVYQNQNLDNPEKAAQYQQQAETLRRQSEGKLKVLIYLSTLGLRYEALDHQREANACFREAVQLAETQGLQKIYREGIRMDNQEEKVG